jgi:hypothetical protein
MNKYCQGPDCHTYQTTDRKRGPKGDKHYQTRTLGRYGYGDNNFCTNICLGDWWAKHGTQAVEHFGRLREPKILTKESAWKKDYTYSYVQGGNGTYNHCFYNGLTNERIPITEQQYNDKGYTLERARQNIV